MTPFEVYNTRDLALVEEAYKRSYKYRKDRIFRGSDLDVEPGEKVRLSSFSDSQKRHSKVGLKKAIQPPWSSEIHRRTTLA